MFEYKLELSSAAKRDLKSLPIKIQNVIVMDHLIVTIYDQIS